MGNTVKTAAVCSLSLCAMVACSKPSKHDDGAKHEDLVTVPGSTAQDACAAANHDECDKARARIAELQAQRDQAVAANDYAAVARISLELNFQTELLELLKTDTATAENRDALETKYKALSERTEAWIASRGQTPAPQSHDGETQPVSDKLPAVVYHKLEVEAVHKVMADFGDLYVADMGKEADGKPHYEQVELEQKPWSGYWLPLRSDVLFEGDNAPLVKLDKIMAARGNPTHAADSERTMRDMLSEDSWEGHCAAWAVASISSKEPLESREVEGFSFDPGEQKALLTKVFMKYPTTVYGIRYDGDVDTDGTLQDIRPEAFHRVFEAMIVEKKLPFIVDEDPGIEVWSKPVFRVRWTVQKDPNIQDAFIVDALPYMIADRKQMSSDPTTIDDVSRPAYQYRLYVDPKTVKDGKFKVIAGEWLGDSRKSHPDSIMIPVPGGQIGSSNAEINKALDLVKQITGLN